MRYVLDASAVLAAVNEERGADRVAQALDNGVMSAVNVAEVVAGLSRNGNDAVRCREILRALAITIVPPDEEMAIDAGLLRSVTDRAGLSLADRFCLALARRLGSPALTADRQWSAVAGEAGVAVELLR